MGDFSNEWLYSLPFQSDKLLCKEAKKERRRKEERTLSQMPNSDFCPVASHLSPPDCKYLQLQLLKTPIIPTQLTNLDVRSLILLSYQLWNFLKIVLEKGFEDISTKRMRWEQVFDVVVSYLGRDHKNEFYGIPTSCRGEYHLLYRGGGFIPICPSPPSHTWTHLSSPLHTWMDLLGWRTTAAHFTEVAKM